MSRHAVLHQAAACCLTYPDASFHDDLPLLREATAGLRGRPVRLLRGFLDHAEATPRAELAAHYVRVFDFKNRRSLYLTWWTDGDTRRRGMSLVRLKETYRAHGLDFADGDELPDFLPAVLEFSARAGTDTLLRRHRPALELLRLSLADCETPYAAVLAAVCATLPGASPKDRAAARAMARGGPPREDVGLEPFGPHVPETTGVPR
ncbi:nitrate reductase molybdenum cofactor assembly chaperone [Streptomyces albiaxialis]|uniref:Nitrate reductase molybdenum cofactor assembly chaperone n=1 Tax=Streptomyces albiaxialis TaxID=329523 RepID=A0ABN2W1J3_9ACTN